MELGGSIINEPAITNNKQFKVAYCHDIEGNLLEVVETPMNKQYLAVAYDLESHPYSDYPSKLCAYLFQVFNLKEGMKMLEPGCGEESSYLTSKS